MKKGDEEKRGEGSSDYWLDVRKRGGGGGGGSKIGGKLRT